MKQVKSILKGKFNPVSTADAVNHENAPAWTKPAKEMLEQFAMTGVLQQSFYATAEMHTEDALAVLKANTAKDIAEAIERGRNKGFIRTFPILGLAYLSTVDCDIFKQTFPKVVLTGGDLGDFIDICKSMRGFGRAVKTAISTWLDKNMNSYYAQKYRKQLADAIRLVRYKGDKNVLTGYVLAGYGNKVNGWTSDKLDKARLDMNIRAHEDFITACNAGDKDTALSIIREFNLDVDSLTSVYDKFDAKIWMEIAKKTPVMRFLKYLNKFADEDVFSHKTGISIATQKLTVENLQKAKVFPFRLYTAYREVTNGYIGNLLAKVMNDYTDKMDWGVFNKYSWAICPDVSGSMTWSHGGNGKLRPCDVAGMFSGFFNKGLEDCVVFPWDTMVYGFHANKYDSVMTQINAVSKADGGGTDMSCALNFMIENHIRKDCVAFITDTEEYCQPWIKAWREYRSKVNGKAKAFIIRCDCYGTNPFPNDIAEKLDVYPIYGFNDNVIKYMEYILAK